MSASEDISNLFRKFGGQPDGYQELTRDMQAEESKARWPLLSSVQLAENVTAPSVKDGMLPAAGAPVPNLQGRNEETQTASPFAPPPELPLDAAADANGRPAVERGVGVGRTIFKKTAASSEGRDPAGAGESLRSARHAEPSLLHAPSPASVASFPRRGGGRAIFAPSRATATVSRASSNLSGGVGGMVRDAAIKIADARRVSSGEARLGGAPDRDEQHDLGRGVPGSTAGAVPRRLGDAMPDADMAASAGRSTTLPAHGLSEPSRLPAFMPTRGGVGSRIPSAVPHAVAGGEAGSAGVGSGRFKELGRFASTPSSASGSLAVERPPVAAATGTPSAHSSGPTTNARQLASVFSRLAGEPESAPAAAEAGKAKSSLFARLSRL